LCGHCVPETNHVTISQKPIEQETLRAGTITKSMSKRSQPEPEIIDAQVIDNESASDLNRSLASSLLPCKACGSPRQVGSRFCVACGVPFETPNEILVASPQTSTYGSPNFRPETSVYGSASSPNVGRVNSASPVATKSNASLQPSVAKDGNMSVETHSIQSEGGTRTFRCNNCGSEVDAGSDQRSLRCPFCDSTYVAELPIDQRTSQRPEFIIGFEITKEKAQDMFFAWLGKNSFFRPGDLQSKAVTDKQQGIYIPFWHFSMMAMSQWSAQIGEYWYRTETYTVKDSDGKTRQMTRVVRETEWWPLSGIYRKYYSGYMVSASKGLPQNEALAIQPYQLSKMMRYRPMYLAGWMAEEYSISREAALNVTQQEFRNRDRAAIANFLPGDTNSGLTVQTDLDVGGSDLILLPVHVLSYRYRDRVYRFLVNGQTGKTYGEKPWSSSRIAAVAIAVAMLILIGIALIVVLNHPGLGP
jgi:hypothetical protein